MIELHDNELWFRFPDIHKNAECRIEFQRTLRIPDDNREYPLPPGLGRFPVTHVDDYADRLPDTWRRRGGVFLPMYQSEALWVNFNSMYPCAVKVAAGKINAVSGKLWTEELDDDPQDYVVIPGQPWLDGFNVADGYIRQFVAMPLGAGFSAEEQITGKAEHGGIQLIAYPMKAELYKKRQERIRALLGQIGEDDEVLYCLDDNMPVACESAPEMGLAPGGMMRQEIYEDEEGIDAWDQDHGFRCFVHLANSVQYQTITGQQPPHSPPSAKDYTNAGLPWFDYYDDSKALPGSDVLSKLASVAAKTIVKGQKPMADNDPVHPKNVAALGESSVVRDGEF